MQLAPGLSVEEASRICRDRCRAQCCRGPQFLWLGAEEIAPFRAQAAAFGVEARVVIERDGTGSIRFLDHDGETCPMLDAKTCSCRIYGSRPQRCREFPDRVRPGCAISGG
ncbi:MAG: YkgJ family cysteine cluster protein [Deltaproteobacteria bacterium]|nr:YkgJ family cysteine cluster protein [Deltaproteobacteria bacterium]